MRRRAFEAVVTDYGPVVWRVCRAVVDAGAAEDAWSETFLAALQAYPDLRPDSNVEAWLVTIAHRKAIDHVRAQARHAIPTDVLPDRSSTHGLPGNRDDELWTALAALPPKQRHVVVYHYIAGLPYADVAAIVGGSADAARRASADGIATLRRSYASNDSSANNTSAGAAVTMCHENGTTAHHQLSKGDDRHE